MDYWAFQLFCRAYFRVDWVTLFALMNFGAVRNLAQSTLKCPVTRERFFYSVPPYSVPY